MRARKISSSSLSPLGDFEAVLGRHSCTITPISLRLPKTLGFTAWQNVLRAVVELRQQNHWWLADAWAFGQFKFGERTALVETGHWGTSVQTCMNKASVARKFTDETSRRRELSFTHHAKVCALPANEPAELLDLSVKKGWSTRDLEKRD